MKFERTRVGLFVGIICALIASAIAGRGDGLYVPAPSWTYSITSLGTGVATALGIAVGSAGGPVTNGGALGTPSSGVATNLTSIPVANATGVLPVANGGLAATSIPSLKVTLTGGNQSVTSGTITKVAFDTVAIDTGSFWSTSNKNYLPTVAGTYAFCAQVAGLGTFTLGNDLAMFISKNGIAGGAGTALTSYQGTIPTSTASTQAMHDCTIVSMNGSSDTIEVDAAVTGTGTAFVSNSLPQTYLIGWRISP